MGATLEMQIVDNKGVLFSEFVNGNLSDEEITSGLHKVYNLPKKLAEWFLSDEQGGAVYGYDEDALNYRWRCALECCALRLAIVHTLSGIVLDNKDEIKGTICNISGFDIVAIYKTKQ